MASTNAKIADARAHPERQHERGGAREPEVRAQLSRGVPGVLPQMIEPGQSTHVATLLLALFEAADGAEGLQPRVARRHALRHVLVDLAIEVIAELLVELVLDGVAHEERAQPQPGDAEPAPHDQAFRTTREIAADRRSHWAASCASAFRPSRVSV